MSYSYDLNSNITSLTRHGKSEQYTSLGSVFYNYGLIDNLSITRNGNRLKKVTDQCDELTYAGAMDFKDGANEQIEYTYDANGNMTSDLNKGISEIKYNILNLPEKITHNNGHITYITYAADGRKLRVTYKINPLIAIGDPVIHPGEPVDPIGPLSMLPANELNGNGGSVPIDLQPVSIERVIMTRDYCGAYSYRNGAIERILMGNGFMQDSLYFVQIKDYQGNVRAVLDQNHNVVERNDYYPYGGLINASDTQLQPYKYSSKELDRENGLDLYDSQARWYDPMLPQTTTQDPLAEKYFSISPYTWCAGNPVNRIDPNGQSVIAEHKMQYILNMGFSPEEQKYILFNSYGLLNNSVIQQAPILSENMGVLKELSKSELNYLFILRETDFEGNPFYYPTKDNSNYRFGITYFPETEYNPSNNDVYLVTWSQANEEQQVIISAHEGFVHGYFFELKNNGVDVNPYHTYGKHFEPDGSPMFEKDNSILEDWLKIIINNAKENYEKNINSATFNNSNNFSWPNY